MYSIKGDLLKCSSLKCPYKARSNLIEKKVHLIYTSEKDDENRVGMFYEDTAQSSLKGKIGFKVGVPTGDVDEQPWTVLYMTADPFSVVQETYSQSRPCTSNYRKLLGFVDNNLLHRDQNPGEQITMSQGKDKLRTLVDEMKPPKISRDQAQAEKNNPPEVPSLNPQETMSPTSNSSSALDEIQNLSLSSPEGCLLYTSPSPRDVEESRMPSSA